MSSRSDGMIKNQIIGYEVKLDINDRKRAFVRDTLRYFTQTSDVFRKGLICLFAGVNPEMISGYLPEGESSDLWCAVNWFRLVDLSEGLVSEEQVVDGSELCRRFQNYAGHAPDRQAEIYLTRRSEGDVQYVWADCHAGYRRFCREVGLSPDEMEFDVLALVARGYIKFDKGENDAWGFVSAVFGDGVKEDTKNKIRMLEGMRRAAHAKPATYEELQESALRETGCSDIKQMIREYKSGQQDDKEGVSKSSGGSHAFFVKYFLRGADRVCGPIGEKELASFVNSCDKTLKQKTSCEEAPITHSAVWKRWFKRRIPHTVGSIQEPYSVACDHAMADISSKNCLNARMVSCPDSGQVAERRKKGTKAKKGRSSGVLEMQDKVSSLSSNGVDLAKAVFDSFNDALDRDRKEDEDSCRFEVLRHHLGKLSDLYEIWVKNDCDSGIVLYLEEYEGSISKQPKEELLRAIYPHRESIKAKEFMDAAHRNDLIQKIESRKAHPTVRGNRGVGYGNSKMRGKIMPQSNMHNGRKAGLNPEMWLEADLLNGERWEKHHLKFHSSQFFDQVYCHKDGLPNTKIPGLPRLARHGMPIGLSISPDDVPLVNRVSGNGRRCPRANKRNLRAVANITHNVELHPETAFEIRSNGEYASISHRVQDVAEKSIEAGDLILGYDRNQTAQDTYAVLRVVNEGGHAHRGNMLEIVAVGKISSKSMKRRTDGSMYECDDLSYDGLPYSEFSEWREERKAFMHRLIPLLPPATKKLGSRREPMNLPRELEALTHCKSLYVWNRRFLTIFRIALKRALKELASDLFRQEILDICHANLSPLKRSSLSKAGVESLQRLKSLVLAYLSKMKAKREDSLLEADPEFAELFKVITDRLNAKRLEKAKRTASDIVRLANLHGCSFVSGESDLPTTSKGKKNFQNATNMDWMARRVEDLVKGMCKRAGIAWRGIDPSYTSQRDPFQVEADGRSVLRCRFYRAESASAPDCVVDGLVRYTKNAVKNMEQSNPLSSFQRGGLAFCSQYGIEPARLTPRVVREVLAKHEVVYVPRSGGRYFFATLPLVAGSPVFEWGGQQMHVIDADEVAAINIALEAIPSKLP